MTAEKVVIGVAVIAACAALVLWRRADVGGAVAAPSATGWCDVGVTESSDALRLNTPWQCKNVRVTLVEPRRMPDAVDFVIAPFPRACEGFNGELSFFGDRQQSAAYNREAVRIAYELLTTVISHADLRASAVGKGCVVSSVTLNAQ